MTRRAVEGATFTQQLSAQGRTPEFACRRKPPPKQSLRRFIRERVSESRVHRRMSIDKESNGIPEVNFSKKTTKVNVWMVGGIVIFFLLMGILLVYFANRGGT